MSSQYHELKCLSQFFQAVERGEKKAELRLNDRNFQVGDTVRLEETDVQDSGQVNRTGKTLLVVITHILHHRECIFGKNLTTRGLERNWVVFSFEKL